MRRMILVPLLIIVAVLAILGGAGYWVYNNYYFYTTDDAQVTGQIVNVSSPAAGELTTLAVKQGDVVAAGDIIAKVTTTSTLGDKSVVNITSPIAGTIVQTSAVQGQNLTPGLALGQVTNLKNLSITSYVDENELNNVKLGQDVDVHIDAFSGTTYSGHVQRIVQATAGSFSLLPTTDYASGNFTKVAQRVPVIVSLDSTGSNDVVPGMSAAVTIHVH